MKNKGRTDNKKIIVCSVIIVVLIISIILIFKENKKSYYIILDNNEIIEYKNGKYDYTSNTSYLNEFFRTFHQNNYMGTYTISSVDDFTKEVFFSNSSSKDMFVFDTPLLAISTDIDFITYENLNFDETDFEMFASLNAKGYITKLSDLYDTSKVILDFDNDGKDEMFFTVTYEEIKNDIEEVNENNYSLMYYVDDDNSISLLAEGEPYNEKESIVFPNYMISSIIDVNNDDIYEIIVMNRMYDEPIYEIYEFIDNKYTLVFATDIGAVYEK